MKNIVIKFGGTSTGAERIAGVADIARDFLAGRLPHAKESGRPLVIVVSAFSGVTDALIKAARSAARRDEQTFRQVAQDLRQKHWAAIEALIPFGDRQASLRAEVEALVSGFENLCRAITILGELTPRGLDAVVSLGERLGPHHGGGTGRARHPVSSRRGHRFDRHRRLLYEATPRWKRHAKIARGLAAARNKTLFLS
jgi:aspartokinase